mgnify:CR=1 FL=1
MQGEVKLLKKVPKMKTPRKLLILSQYLTKKEKKNSEEMINHTSMTQSEMTSLKRFRTMRLASFDIFT